MSLPCHECNALCCQYFCFEIDEPDDFEEFEDVRWYLCHDGVSVHVDEEGDWFIQIENPCRKMDNEHRCVIYEDRPLICRNYGGQCEHASEEGYGYKEEFKTPEELDAFAKKTLGRTVYEREMIKTRAKLDGVPKNEMRARLMARGIIGARKK